MDDQAARLEEIRKLMYSEPAANSAQDVLELTEDDLYDEYDDDLIDYNHASNNVPTNSETATFKNNLNNKIDSVNENLTPIRDNTSNVSFSDPEVKLDKQASDSLISNEAAANAIQSIETLKRLIKRFEKTTIETTKNVTLEEVVTSTIKPFLKDWLSQYLHSIVQAIVDKEIQKLVTEKEEKHE